MKKPALSWRDRLLPFVVFALALGLWEGAVRYWRIEPFVLSLIHI